MLVDLPLAIIEVVHLARRSGRPQIRLAIGSDAPVRGFFVDGKNGTAVGERKRSFEPPIGAVLGPMFIRYNSRRLE